MPTVTKIYEKRVSPKVKPTKAMGREYKARYITDKVMILSNCKYINKKYADKLQLAKSTPDEYLIEACKENDLRRIQYGLAMGGNPNYAPDAEKPILFHVLNLPASQWSKGFDKMTLKSCELLLQNGCKINQPDRTDYKDVETYRMIDTVGASNNTLLHHASFHVEEYLLQYLLSKDADPTIEVRGLFYTGRIPRERYPQI